MNRDKSGLSLSGGRFFIVFLVIVLLCPASALAQTGGIPEFLPASPWMVGQAEQDKVRGLQGVSIPCMMAAQYDNGFVVRLAGGGGTLQAMAIDFRQNAFSQGARYPATLFVDGGVGGSVRGSAFSQTILVFNLRSLSGLYQAFQQGRVMELTIGSNRMRFSLSNLSEGMGRLERCYTGSPGGPSAPQAASFPSSQAALAAPALQPLPTSMADIKAASSAGAPSQSGMMRDEVYIRRDGTQQSISRQDTSPAPLSSLPPPRQPTQTAAPSMTTSTASSASFPSRSRSMSPGGGAFGGAGAQFHAAPGAGVKNVLERWAHRQNVRLIWNADYNYPVKQAVSEAGSFDMAVQALLQQYDADKDRPVGRLNTDPITGKRLLIIDTDRSL